MKNKNIISWAKFTLIIEFFVNFISSTFKVPKNKIWQLIDEIQRELLKKGLIDDTINQYIIKTPELLDIRVKKDVDVAIANYLDQEIEKVNMKNTNILKEIESPKYTETQEKIVKEAIYYEKAPDNSVAQSILGGEMGIKSEWSDKD